MLFGINDAWDIEDRRNNGRPLVDEIGAHCVRANALWANVQYWDADNWYWDYLDAMVYDFWTNSNKLFILQAIMAPRWALTPEDQVRWDNAYGSIILPHAPAYDNHFSEFIRQLANRYGLAAIEIWNEPNLPGFGNIPPRRMAEIIRAACVGLAQSNNPDLQLLSPAPYPNTVWRSYLHTMLHYTWPYDFAVGCHPYSRHRDWKKAVAGTVDLFKTTKETAAGKKVWVTEVGFSSGSMGVFSQAKACKDAFERLSDNGAQSIIWHRMAADRNYQPDNEWEQGLGVCNPDWTKKPAFYALKG